MQHFWPLYSRLDRLADDQAPKPAYFRFLTLLGRQALTVTVHDSMTPMMLTCGICFILAMAPSSCSANVQCCVGCPCCVLESRAILHRSCLASPTLS